MRFFHGCCGKNGDRPDGRGARILRFGGHALLGAVVMVVVATVVGVVVMVAWNALMPTVFHLPALEFWQAVALLVLARLLTGRLHHRGGHGGRWHRRGCCSSRERAEGESTPPNGDEFAQWWWEEGRATFQTYRSRKESAPPSGGQD